MERGEGGREGEREREGGETFVVGSDFCEVECSSCLEVGVRKRRRNEIKRRRKNTTSLVVASLVSQYLRHLLETTTHLLFHRS